MEQEINYLLAIGYALIGWVVQCTAYYFKFDTDEAFDRAKFWRVYDKYIILGFATAIAIALLGDYPWPMFNKLTGLDLHYDEKANIILGAISTLIFLFFSRNAHKKLDQ